MRGVRRWETGMGRPGRAAAAVRAREARGEAHLDLVAAPQLGHPADLVALGELGQRLVHEVAHVLATPAHRARPE